MDNRAWAIEMARYNRWQNETLYELCDGLPDEDRRRDRGMFFSSIHATLNHILLVDMLLRDYAVDETPPTVFDPGKIVHDDYADLAAARTAFDNDLIALCEQQAPAWYDARLTFKSQRLQQTREFPRKLYFMQLFNHGTHHRAQVTAELHRAGLDYGNTDLPFNPYTQY